jgi:membrane protease YdiL (CAAX protease family)
MKILSKENVGLPKVRWAGWQTLLVFALAWLIVPLVVLSLMSVLGIWIPSLRHWVNLLEKGDETVTFIYVIIEAIAALGSAYWLARHYGQGWHDLGWRKVNILRAILYVLVWLIIAGIIIAAVLTLVAALIPAFNANQEQVNEFTKPSTSAYIRIVSLFALVIIPPIIEETIFRGFIFPAFAKHYGIIAGALISSLLFGIAHFQPNVSIYTFILGLILCRLYYKFGSIVPGIAFHMLNNYLAYYAIYHKS